MHVSNNKILVGTRNGDIYEFINTEEAFSVIKQNDIVLGYFVVAQAPSKFHQFDYYIIFNSDAQILKIEILQYRENYGSEICSKNWLANFANFPTSIQRSESNFVSIFIMR